MEAACPPVPPLAVPPDRSLRRHRRPRGGHGRRSRSGGGPHPVDHRGEAHTSAPASDELSAAALQREYEAQQKEARQEAQTQNQAKPQAPKKTYKGRVIASPYLLLRDKPTRSSKVVGSVKYGTVVNIFCKTTGDNVDGNNRWYLLTDGTWAWGSARYIENIGAAPRFC